MLLSAGHQSDPTIHICILSHIIFHYGLSQDINYSSLCYTIGPCGPSFLYIIVCIYQPKFPAHPSPCPLWQLQVCSLCEPVTMIWQEKGREKKKKPPNQKMGRRPKGHCLIYTLSFQPLLWSLQNNCPATAFPWVGVRPLKWWAESQFQATNITLQNAESGEMSRCTPFYDILTICI